VSEGGLAVGWLALSVETVTSALTIGIPLAAAAVSFLAAVLVAFLSRLHDRQQQARVVLLAPAQDFARHALASLAALRYVSPPQASSTSRRPDRNAVLLTDPVLRERRLQACREAIDLVRRTRGDVRLVFHPMSWAAEFSRRVLMQLRLCLESAETFYADYDAATASGSHGWLSQDAARGERERYESHRQSAYEELDGFFEDVAERLVKPSWNPSKIEPARPPVGAPPALPPRPSSAP
jgi:hypothetical protein